MLTRTGFIESVGRYERLFKRNPYSRVAQFTERVPVVTGGSVGWSTEITAVATGLVRRIDLALTDPPP
jgi:hypothetical protein